MEFRCRNASARTVTATVIAVVGVLLFGRGPAAASQRSEPWESVEILAGASAEEMDLYMRAMNASLGVGCDYCHESSQWAVETPVKQSARGMMRMVESLGGSGFEALDAPTCWTCHRGSAVPPSVPSTPADRRRPGVFAQSREPAGRVYDNVRQYAELPAADLSEVMAGYTAALGVGCEYCHEAGNWASDDQITKLLSRRMFEIQAEANAASMTRMPLSCWTCHQGSAVPETRLPIDLFAR